ncbi:DUF4080 domain-containing protein [uncultured Sanguibacteroides sp.]|uniref:B12-binding domain-containing radical SAM protein n=1 Tax=uncultured Sanguibacteroides sp. TaxID=1635151 RepID=UPI0025E0F973|nr:DUF4080 domain-containing protein [uncultured Sanguibacteroides sp.]
MRLLWLDLNSSYAHSSLALPAIHAQVTGTENEVEWVKVSATINSNVGSVVAEIVGHNPQVLAATAWLFTREVLHKIIIRVKALLPDCVVILGGPEMLGDNKAYLRKFPFVNCVFRGEGELGFHEWLSVYDQPAMWDRVTGLCWLDRENIYRDNGIAKVEAFEQLNIPERSRFFDWSKPFVQLETTRGCFNTCAFCVSGGEKPVRILPVERIRERLDLIRAKGVRDVRLLDRTFNGSSRRAIELLSLFREYAGTLHFHLEIHPALLSEDVMSLLKEMPDGLLHLEAGIQSLREKVLSACTRIGNLQLALEGLRYLSSLPNLVVHADLIAGLPLYSLKEMFEDVRTLASFGTGEIQLELLKLLPGTVMRQKAEEWGIVYAEDPPYEVLRTSAMTVEDLREARLLSRVIDGFYNALAWQPVTRKLIVEQPLFLRDFLFWLEERDLLEQPLSLEKRGTLLYEFCRQRYTVYLPEISVAWIASGIPFTKEPGGRLEAWNGNLPSDLRVLSGEWTAIMRLYRLPFETETYWFGFDRSKSQSKPLFIARN